MKEEQFFKKSFPTHYWAGILMFSLAIIMGCTDSSNHSFIAVNLVGYDTESQKQAFLVHAQSSSFEIRDVADNEIVFSNFMGSNKEPDLSTGDRITVLDFSAFKNPGEYIITISDSVEISSHPFVIKENVYKDALSTILESYYYHRCGSEVKNNSPWGYSVCHLENNPFYGDSSQSKSVTGGWHDAGDYNKFSGNTALSAGLILYAYEQNPGGFPDSHLDIPESENGIPDLLDEVSWALNWLLTMQREDGAVYHKVSQEKWIGEFLPNRDPSIRYIFDVSSAATASFAAVAALGSRHLALYNSSLSNQLSEAALRAWSYLELNRDNVPNGGFKNPPGVTGGEYGDPSDTDERLWASVELYRLTKNDDYLNFFIQNVQKITNLNIPPISWRDANSLAFFAFLSSDVQELFPAETDIIQRLILDHADSILAAQKLNNYKNLLHENQYYWGSNSVGLALAFDLIQAYKITGDITYKESALDQLHYIFGRNPFNQSQVTGVGFASVKHPYHQLSEMDSVSDPIPGMLVGGPNSTMLLNNRVISNHSGKNYEDTFANYLVNEPAINFTAILVYITSFFSNSDLHSHYATSSK